MSDIPERLAAVLADKYAIVREIGSGGMATVYLAEDLRHQRRVAVKVLRPELAATLGSDRFLSEVRIAAQLQHPHILPLLDSGSAEGFLYYVMPFVEGQTLRDRLLKAGELPVPQAVRIIVEITDALVAAHALGVVHRDIKPENILLSGRHALVADFGVAKAVDQATGGQRLTSVGVALGTPTYMAPEQAAAEPHVDHRADIYAVGIVAYELLAGHPPFGGTSAQRILAAHISQPVPPLIEARPGIAQALSDVVMRCLAKRAADRWQSAEELLTALEPLATPSGGITPSSTRPASGATTGAAGASVAAATARTRRLALVAGAVVVVLGGALWAGSRMRATAPLLHFGKTTPITIEPGLEVDPELSPDGATLAYAQGPAGSMAIFVRSLGGGTAVQVSKERACDARNPRWSPDGSKLLFHCGAQLLLVPALGGPAQLVADSAQHAAWAPDGRQIAFVRAGRFVVRRALAGGETVRLADEISPHSLRWSPDGEHLVFVADNDLFLFGVNTMGNLAPNQVMMVSRAGGDARALTNKKFLHESPIFVPDGRALLLVSSEGGGRDIFQLPLAGGGVSGGPLVRLTTGLGAGTIALSRDGARLVYTTFANSANVWAVAVPPPGATSSTRNAVPVTTGNQHVEGVAVSPDGEWLAFDSDRGGNADIWKMRLAGGEPEQLTNDPSDDFIPQWSGDGKWLAFQTWRNGNRDVYLVRSSGGPAQQVTNSPDHEMYASLSPDGRTLVYHHTLPGGAIQLERRSRMGDSAWSAATVLGTGAQARISPDGRAIAYERLGSTERIPVEGGPATTLMTPIAEGKGTVVGAGVCWSPDGKTVYVKALHTATGQPSIWAVPAAGGAPRLVVRFDDPNRPSGRQEFSTDGKRFYFTVDNRQSDISIVDVARP
ncbi:MAG: PD40 domain-containing protein [Gemmatimonadetes bacterium]|nr:PD40 domain-containing protein [Gemmatimonadota bacterium]